MTPAPLRPIAWTTTAGLTPYEPASAWMDTRVEAIRRGEASELVWLLEHPPLYTAGTSADPKELMNPQGLPVFATGRGGRYTFHGPGQRVAYILLDVKTRFGGDVRAFVTALERWLIEALTPFGLKGRTYPDRVGVWVDKQTKGRREEAKIAAIGIRIRHGVSFHGVSLNIDPDLTLYQGIIPCGIADHGVTSLADLGISASIKDVDISLAIAFERLFRRPVLEQAPRLEPITVR